MISSTSLSNTTNASLTTIHESEAQTKCQPRSTQATADSEAAGPARAADLPISSMDEPAHTDLRCEQSTPESWTNRALSAMIMMGQAAWHFCNVRAIAMWGATHRATSTFMQSSFSAIVAFFAFVAAFLPSSVFGSSSSSSAAPCRAQPSLVRLSASEPFAVHASTVSIRQSKHQSEIQQDNDERKPQHKKSKSNTDQKRPSPSRSSNPQTSTTRTTTISLSATDPNGVSDLTPKDQKTVMLNAGRGDDGPLECRLLDKRHSGPQPKSSQECDIEPLHSTRTRLSQLPTSFFIEEMTRTELQFPENVDVERWMVRALCKVWKGGDSVLRSCRVCAREMNDTTRYLARLYFSPLFVFTRVYIAVRLPSAIIDELHMATTEFEQALEQMYDVAGVIRASKAGYRLRDLWLRLSAGVDEEFVPVLARCMSLHPDGAMALAVLSHGLDGGAMLRRKWVAKTMKPKRGTVRRIFAIPRAARRMWRTQKWIVRGFEEERMVYIASHQAQPCPPASCA